MNRLAVIGCNSFSGSHFVRYALEQGCTVLGTSRTAEPHAAFWPLAWEGLEAPRARYTFLAADLNRDLARIRSTLAAFQPEAIVNFAALGMVAESWQYPGDYYLTNLLSQVALHEAIRRLACLKKYVHVGTPEVYGHTTAEIDESAPFHPSTPYAGSRAACDLHLETYLKEYAFPVVWTRSANVYGPGQQLYRIVPRTMLSLRLGWKLPLHGGGMSTRSFVHIRDVCRATFDIVQKAVPGSRYHLATRKTISIRELVQQICRMVGGNFEQLVESTPERPGKDSAYWLNSDRVRREFGWTDRVSLADGLSETLAWIDRYLPELRQLPLEYRHRS